MKQEALNSFVAVIVFNASLYGLTQLLNNLGAIPDLWNSIVPSFFLCYVAKEVCNGLWNFGFFKSLQLALIKTTIFLAIFASITLFIIANLRMSNQTIRACISGFVYPGLELCLKMAHRNVMLKHHEDTEVDEDDAAIKENALVYLARNLDIVLGNPNILLIFLLESRFVFTMALIAASICEIGGMVISNMRFLKQVRNVTQKVKKRLTGAARVAPPPPDDVVAAISNSSERVNAIVENMQIEKSKQKLAIVRNNEEIAEKALIFSTPIIISLLIKSGIVQGHLGFSELVARAAIASGLELIVDSIKMRVNAMFQIWDHLIKNRMDVFDALNIATIGFVAQSLFLFSVAYTQSSW